jgi:AcrR family transcriptional regulator
MAERRLEERKAPRQQRAVETRARILDAARGVFAEHGYAAGTTNRIAEAAGMSVGSLYQYFPNKDAILVVLVRDHIADGTAEVQAALAAGDDGAPLPDTVRRVVAALYDVHAREPRLHRVLFEESPRPPSLLRELHRLEDEIVALVAERLRTEQPALEDPELTARIAVCTIESLVHRLVATDRPPDRDRFVDEVTHLVGDHLTRSPSTHA